MSTHDNIHRRRLRAIFMMEFRLGLYEWLTRSLSGRPRMLWVPPVLLAIGCALLWVGSPSLGSQIPRHWVAGAPWVSGGLLLVFGIASLLLAPAIAAGTERAMRLADLLPLYRCQRHLAATLGRLLACGIAIGLGVILVLLSWAAARPLGLATPSLAPLRFWLLGAPFLLVLGLLVQWLGGDESPEDRGSLTVSWVLICAGGYLGVQAARQVPHVWQLAHGAAVAIVVCSAVSIGLTWIVWLAQLLYGQATALWASRRPAGAAVTLRHAPPAWWRQLDFRWVWHPELDLRLWAKSAAAVFGILAILAALLILVWPVLLSRMDDPNMDRATTIRVGATICTLCLPLVAVLLSGMLWNHLLSRPMPKPGQDGPLGPHVEELIPFPDGHRWRAKLVAAAVFAVGCVALGWVFTPLGYVIARACGGVEHLQGNLHWATLTAPALVLLAWAAGPLLHYPIKLSFSHGQSWVWAAVVVTLVMAGVMAMFGGLAVVSFLPGGAAECGWIWPLLAWVIAAVVLARSRAIDRRAAWPLDDKGGLGYRGELRAIGAGLLSMFALASVMALAWAILMMVAGS